MRRLLYLFVLVALIVVGVLFGSINQQVVDLNLLVVSLSLRVVDIAIIFFLLGLIFSLLIIFTFSVQRKAKNWLRKSSEKT